MRKKMFIAVPAALALIAGSALWVRAAESAAGTPACADIVDGRAVYEPPTKALPDLPQSWINPGSFEFRTELAAPTCPDVQYGLVVLASLPAGDVPIVLDSQSVVGDGVSSFIQYDLDVTMDPAQETVCVYLYTVGSSGGSTTTPSNGNPHSQTIASAGTELLDRAPDGTGEALYCNAEGEGTGGRGYN